MNGKILDSFALRKPANWNATAANAARAAANTVFVSNFSNTNTLDANGQHGSQTIPSTP